MLPMQVVDDAPKWTCFEQRGHATRTREGVNLNGTSIEGAGVAAPAIVFLADIWGGLTALTAYARVTLGD